MINLSRIHQELELTKNISLIQVKITVNSNLKDDLITETLAKIYIEQEKYNKAIKAYEILSLKYPKKVFYLQTKLKG